MRPRLTSGVCNTEACMCADGQHIILHIFTECASERIVKIPSEFGEDMDKSLAACFLTHGLDHKTPQNCDWLNITENCKLGYDC